VQGKARAPICRAAANLGVRARGWEAGVIPGGRFGRQLRCGGDGPAGGATASAALRRGRVTGRLAGGSRDAAECGRSGALGCCAGRG